jgi:hypothetical protein
MQKKGEVHYVHILHPSYIAGKVRISFIWEGFFKLFKVDSNENEVGREDGNL